MTFDDRVLILELLSPMRRRLSIEAKGQTSSFPHTRRHGTEFSASQKQNHLGEALVAVLAPRQPGGTWGIALPGDSYDVELVERLREALDRLGVLVFLVNPDTLDVCVASGKLPS